VEAIGRFTTARGVITSQLQNERFSLGPIIELSDPASLEALYIRLQEDLHGSLGVKYEAELNAFRNLSLAERLRVTLDAMETISRDDETIYIRCRSGFFGDNGILLDWARSLFEMCRDKPQIRISIICNRQPRQANTVSNHAVGHAHIHDLPQDDIRALVQTATLQSSGDAIPPTNQALIAIGGHPMLARYYAAALTKYGPTAENQAWYDTVFEQRNILLEFLGYDALQEEDRKILSILSWFPKVSSKTLERICENISISDFRIRIEDLVSGSLVNYFSGNYSISGPVRLVFRQMYGVGDEKIIAEVGEEISNLIKEEENFKTDMIETVAFLFNLHGKNLPSTIERVVSPSAMLQTARELYRVGRDKPGNAEYERCVTLCDAALQTTDEPAIISDLMIVQSRSLLRMRRFEQADIVIKNIEKRFAHRSSTIRAQYYRLKGDHSAAIPLYAAIIQSGTNDDAVIHEYCICLRETGAFEKVKETIGRFSGRVEKNIYLLDMKASLEIGAGDFRRADKTISVMRKLPDSREAAARKEAILLCKETGNYPAAAKLIGDAIRRLTDGGKGALGDLYATRCVIYSKLSQPDAARRDLAMVKGTHRQSEFVSARLAIYVMMADGENLKALNTFDALQNKTRLDNSLRRDILARLADDKNLLISDRSKFRDQYISSTLDRVSFTEFDF